MKTKSQTLIKLVLLTQFIFITLINISISQDFSSKHFKIEKLSSGVYAAIHSFGGYAICNSGIVDLGDKVLVFDTFLTVEAAKDFIKQQKQLQEKKSPMLSTATHTTIIFVEIRFFILIRSSSAQTT